MNQVQQESLTKVGALFGPDCSMDVPCNYVCYSHQLNPLITLHEGTSHSGHSCNE
jgi:hypothetical protein